jgi:hypothetical protein
MTMRWTARRKAAVIEAIRSGEITQAWAMLEYDLSAEELAEWIKLYDTDGRPALRATRLQQYRPLKAAETAKPKTSPRQPTCLTTLLTKAGEAYKMTIPPPKGKT